jgi:hypothetical protein
MDDFLKLEYQECLSLIKYYDERHQSLVKFAAGLSSAVPSLLLGIYKIGSEVAPYFWNFTALVAGMTAMSLLGLYVVLIHNRLYFIYPTRQANAIRAMALDQVKEIFQCNQMYTTTDFNAFKLKSTHSFLNGFVALQIGVFISLMIYSLFIDVLPRIVLLISAVFSGCIMVIAVFGVSGIYLYVQGKKHADEAIHGRRIECDDPKT